MTLLQRRLQGCNGSIERCHPACSAFAHRARGVAQAPKRPASEPGSRPDPGALLCAAEVGTRQAFMNQARTWDGSSQDSRDGSTDYITH